QRSDGEPFEPPRGGAVERECPAFAVDADQMLARALEDRPQVRLRSPKRRLSLELLPAGSRTLQRRPYGGADPCEAALQQVVGGAGLHATDCSLLVDRAGYDDERSRRPVLLCEPERGHS